jgi:hypothetical protein
METPAPGNNSNPPRRQNFTLLLNREEYDNLSLLSAQLGISKGATLRCAVRNLLNTTEKGKATTLPGLDTFWSTFRKGG